MVTFHIVTIFPEQIDHFLSFSIPRIAAQKGVAKYISHDLRKWSTGNHKSVDDRPYGGGAGMVLMIEPIYKAIEEIKKESPEAKVIAFTPSGEKLKQRIVREYASLDTDQTFILLCGHYEGFDQRILDSLVDREISIGDYIISGGEGAALIFIDSIARLLPGVLGNESSSIEESFENGLLEYPHYTRPEEFKGLRVPEILLSGNHKEIEKWRLSEALKQTEEKRKDLLPR